MAKKERLREKPGPPVLGRNMHILRGHERLSFVRENMRDGEILDAGCGEGAFAIAVVSPANEVYAIDLFDVSENLSRYGVHFEQVSIEDYQTSRRYDTIMMMEVIEHLEEPEFAIKKMLSLLAEDGVLLITTPHVSTWDGEEDHIWRWDIRSFADMIQDIGLYEAKIWLDSTFIYAVLSKEIGDEFTGKAP